MLKESTKREVGVERKVERRPSFEPNASPKKEPHRTSKKARTYSGIIIVNALPTNNPIPTTLTPLTTFPSPSCSPLFLAERDRRTSGRYPIMNDTRNVAVAWPRRRRNDISLCLALELLRVTDEKDVAVGDDERKEKIKGKPSAGPRKCKGVCPEITRHQSGSVSAPPRPPALHLLGSVEAVGFERCIRL